MKNSPTLANASFFPNLGIGQYLSTQYQSLKNKIKFSDIGIGFGQVTTRISTLFIQFLFKNNSIDQAKFIKALALAARQSAQDPNAHNFPFQIEAKNGVAQRAFALTAFGWRISPRLWTFQAFSGKENLKNFSDVAAGARGFYEPPRNLALFDNFVCKSFDHSYSNSSAAIAEKIEVKETLREDLQRVWLVTKHMCSSENLLKNWDPQKTIAFNMSMLTNRIIMNAKFARNGLPDEVFDLIDEFEEHWHHPEKFHHLSIFEFIKKSKTNRDKFKAISQELNQQGPESEVDNPYLPELKEHPELKIQGDIVETLFKHHSPTHGFKDKKDINTVGFLAMFGNLPKLITGAGLLILSNEKMCAILRDELQRIDSAMDLAKKKENTISPEYDGIEQLLNSEVFFRFYIEVIRYWFNPPFIPRLNTQLFTDYPVGKTKKQCIPARSVSFYADSMLEREGYENPNHFNPFRAEYSFHTSSNGHLTPNNEKTLELLRVFNHEGASRLCPGKQYSYRMFCQVLYHWLHNDYQLEMQFDDTVSEPWSYDVTARSQVGILRQYKTIHNKPTLEEKSQAPQNEQKSKLR